MGANRPFSLGEVSYIRALLIQAGYREFRHFRLFLGIRILITLVALAATLLVSGFKSPVLLFTLPTVAFYMTEFKLMRMVRDRQKRIRFGLIDALDMIALCVESGLPPLQAIKYVAGELREKHPDLYDEFHILCHETAVGCSWDEALYTINAKSETAASKPAFRDPLKFRRCLIPTDGFYEWKRTGTSKQPFCFEIRVGELFAFAGLWEGWKDAEGQWIKTCSILTTTPNAVTSPVNDRMPVILGPDSYDLWLNPRMQNLAAVCELLKPYDAALMRCYPVSSRINHVANDDEDCSRPVEIAENQNRLFA